MQTEDMFVFWNYIGTEDEVSREYNWFKAPIFSKRVPTLQFLFSLVSAVSYVTFILSLQSNFNGSNIFGTMEIRSRHG